jgi:acetyl-CoA synthetase
MQPAEREVSMPNDTGGGGRVFLAARDFLIAHRDDYAAACAGFRWPALDRFNWALDYFDVYARGNDRPALWVVDDDGGETKATIYLTPPAR